MKMVMNKNLAKLLAFGTGFVSLGVEILWTRVLSFTQGQTPQIFATVLALFLIGIVIGSHWGKRMTLCADPLAIRRQASTALFCSALLDVCTPWIWAQVVAYESSLALPLAAIMITLSAATKATLFPVVHHLGTSSNSTDLGRSLSIVYGLNILGSTLGAAWIGFVALELAGTATWFLILGLSTFFLAWLFLPSPQNKSERLLPVVFIFFFLILLKPLLSFNEKFWAILATGGDTEKIAFLAENKTGIIHTIKEEIGGDRIYGGNVYDGRLNTDLLINSNRIDRVAILAGLHAAPKKVLVIGLSGGAWVEIIRHFPSVESIDVVEIQPAYLDLINSTPIVKGLLTDSRVKIHIDDGRRWIKKNRDQHFDLIVMNTTFHWRAYITNLLSQEFLSILHKRMQPNAILAFNSTGSPDVLKTAQSVFTHALRYENFVYAADWNFSQIESANRFNLEQFLDRVIPEESPKKSALFLKLSHPSWVSVEEEERLAGRPLEIITEKNLITEYKYGRGL